MPFATAAALTACFLVGSSEALFAPPQRESTDDNQVQCINDGPETAGDVLIELPGKAGFMQIPDIFQNESLTTAMKETYGIGTDDILPITQIVDIFTSYLKYPIPSAAKAEIQQLIDFYTTERAGSVVCDAYQNNAGWYNRQWRPYNKTMGWHYAVYSKCTPSDGWVGFGADPTVDLTILYDSYATEAVVQQRFKGQDQDVDSTFIYIQSKMAKAGHLSDEDRKVCCFPPSEAERDCSAVHSMIEAYQL